MTTLRYRFRGPAEETPAEGEQSVRLGTVPDLHDDTGRVLEIHLPSQLANEYEVRSHQSGCREFLIPAGVLDHFGPPMLLSQAEVDAASIPVLGAVPKLRLVMRRTAKSHDSHGADPPGDGGASPLLLQDRLPRVDG